MRSDKLILVLALVLLALTLRCPAHAADQWRAATVTGTGGQTGAYTTVAICDSTHFVAISRRATSLTNALTLYTVTGAGAVTATDYTPSSPTLMEKVLAVGCVDGNLYVGGSGVFMESTPLATPGSWSFVSNFSGTGSGFAGMVFASPAGSSKVRMSQSYTGDSKVYVYDLTLPTSLSTLASATPIADEVETVTVPVSSSFLAMASANNSTGASQFRGYVSGSSYAFSTAESSASASTGSYYYQPFGMNSTLGAFTVKRQSNSQIYIRWVNSSGTITNLNTGSTTDLRPLGDWDPTGSLRRGWWLATDGTARKSDSISAPTAISTDATYDVGTTAMQGSTVVVGFTTQYNGSTVGIDLDQDGTSGDAVVLLANKGIAYWGDVAAASPAPKPKRSRVGPFNSLPFSFP